MLDTKSEAQSLRPAFQLIDYARFVIPSVIGVMALLLPIPFRDSINIGMGILSTLIQETLDASLPLLATVVIFISMLVTVVMQVMAKRVGFSTIISQFAKRPVWSLFVVGRVALVSRITAALASGAVLLQIGPAWLVSDTTGGVILNNLIPVLLVIFFIAPFLLPLLTDFGLMELVGTLLRKIFRPLFRLPGRAAIDALASWMGSAPVGVVITTQQYEQGYYTDREAATIATTFSVVSVAFAFVIIEFIGLVHLFLPYYGTVLVAGAMAAIIMPRIPPLSRKSDNYYAPIGKQLAEESPRTRSLLSWGLELAILRARRAPAWPVILRRAWINVLDIWFTLLPLIMTIGTLALVLAEHTPIFRWAALPFVPFLELLGVPEASAAATALLVGFADQFLPAILGQSIVSEHTRFVIACASVTQLVYISEVGALILNSKIPVTLGELFLIFLLRTIITVPVIALVAHLLF